MSEEIVARLSNLPTSITDAHLRELIEPFARVRRVIMPKPVLWQECPTGRAEIMGYTNEDTKLVYVHLHGSIIDGNRINVSFAKIAHDTRKGSSRSFASGCRRVRHRTRSASRDKRKRRRKDSISKDGHRGRGGRRARHSSTPRRRRPSRSSTPSPSIRKRHSSSETSVSRSRSPSWS
uniref:WGS project CAEQ00000000 data, annotated contig 2383 n=1 Tax=Trypanosoma congolense (strain IL3000) TaxID=1068625 RepID=F9WDN1_TRYCI|nr:unnamed protein product [Trypanosoma congolense IL3000]